MEIGRTQRCSRKLIELSYSENPDGKGGWGPVREGATPLFSMRERVAFSALSSLMSVCRGLKNFPKGRSEKTERKKSNRLQGFTLGALRMERRLNARHVVVFEDNSADWSSLKPLKITSNDAPISAAIAAHSEAKPKKVKATKITLMESERAMFIRMMLNVRRE